MRPFLVNLRTYATIPGKPTCTRDCESKTGVQEEKERKIRKIDNLRQNLLLQDTTEKTCPQNQHRNGEIRSIQAH